jgi:hypothetical protein
MNTQEHTIKIFADATTRHGFRISKDFRACLSPACLRGAHPSPFLSRHEKRFFYIFTTAGVLIVNKARHQEEEFSVPTLKK